MKLIRNSTISVHVTKHKSGARGLQRHNEREPGQKHSNENINDERTKDNIFLTEKDGLTFNERIDKIIDENYTGKRAVRKDAVKMCEITVQLGGDMADAPEERQVEALKQAFEELKETYGEKNIVSAVIHLDETTPHLHFDFVPLTDEGKLSAKSVIGGKGEMKKMQQHFLERMQERCPWSGFDRKSDNQFNGLEQSIFEKMTKGLAEKENELFERDDQIEDREIELEELQGKLEKQSADLNQREAVMRQSEQQLNDAVASFNAQARQHVETLRNRESELNEREERLNARESDLDERERELDEKDEKVNEKALRASESLREASKRIEEAEQAETRVRVLYDELRDFSKSLIDNVRGLISKWTGRVRRVNVEPLTQYYDERTEKLGDDIEEHLTKDDFADLINDDVILYDDDMQNAFDDAMTL